MMSCWRKHLQLFTGLQGIATVKLVSLLQLLENLGLSELKYLSQRSCPAVREMFLIIGEVLKEHYLEKIKQVDSFGLLADETSDVSVLAVDNVCEVC